MVRVILAALSVATSAAASVQVSVLPLEEIRPGMTGEGRATFSGRGIETFDVEILGVLEDAMPDRSIILAKLSGGPLAHTGVMQGMSGSPVYVDGRLVGAIAYAFPFAKDPICGITPFEEMVRFTEPRIPPPRGAARAPQLSFSPRGVPSFDPTPVVEPALETDAGQLLPIRTLVAASGLSPAARQNVDSPLPPARHGTRARGVDGPRRQPWRGGEEGGRTPRSPPAAPWEPR